MPKPSADLELLKLLFETHHRHLTERRQKIHAITERTVGLFIVITGSLILSNVQPPMLLRSSLVFVVVLLAAMACYLQSGNNNTYGDIAKVVRKLNERLGLFDKATFGLAEPLYPEKWKSFGSNPLILHHYMTIVSVAAICIIAIITK